MSTTARLTSPPSNKAALGSGVTYAYRDSLHLRMHAELSQERQSVGGGAKGPTQMICEDPSVHLSEFYACKGQGPNQCGRFVRRDNKYHKDHFTNEEQR